MIAVQGMSDAEPLLAQVFLFCGSFGLSFGVAAACTLPWFRPYRPLEAGAAYAVGGAAGGAIQALSLAAIVRFDARLRVVTAGGPLGIVLLIGTLVAVSTGLVVGGVLLRRARPRGLPPADQEDV